jgi:hypothetical protein
MRQVLFVLAILGAMISGWVPVVAATLHAAPQAGMHAMPPMAGDDGAAAGHKGKAAAHPVACSACFAIEAERPAPLYRRPDISGRVPAATPRLAGLGPFPLDPPPRS